MLVSLNQGNLVKFCVAVSFTLVDLKFLIQQSFSFNLFLAVLAAKTCTCKGKRNI